MNPLILVAIFIISTLVGYKLLKNVPSLLHTPLMSGMNALAGVPLLGALAVAAAAATTGSKLLGYLAIILSMINVAGGFYITHRMLRMFRHKDDNAGSGAAENSAIAKEAGK